MSTIVLNKLLAVVMSGLGTTRISVYIIDVIDCFKYSFEYFMCVCIYMYIHICICVTCSYIFLAFMTIRKDLRSEERVYVVD